MLNTCTFGEEVNISKYLINYIEENKKSWKSEPKIYFGDNFQDNIILVFGKPKLQFLLIWTQLVTRLDITMKL